PVKRVALNRASALLFVTARKLARLTIADAERRSEWEPSTRCGWEESPGREREGRDESNLNLGSAGLTAQCHLVFPESNICINLWGGPPGRGRRPRRPVCAGMRLIALTNTGSRGTRADPGSAPRFMQDVR